MHVRLPYRRLAATPAFTLGAIAVLALGTGATLAVFTVLNALTLKALPVPDAHRLVAIEAAWPEPDFRYASNRSAVASVRNSMHTSTSHGRHAAVERSWPAL